MTTRDEMPPEEDDLDWLYDKRGDYINELIEGIRGIS